MNAAWYSFSVARVPPAWWRRGELHLPVTQGAHGWVLHIQTPRAPSPCPSGSTQQLRLSGGTCGSGGDFSEHWAWPTSPFQEYLNAEPLWEKCSRQVPSTRRYGPPGTATKNLSSLNRGEFGQAPRQLTQAWTPHEDFHYRERLMAWINRTHYKSLAKRNKTPFLTFSHLK